MTLDRPTRSDLHPGGNFQDMVGSYLCSRALTALNRRHLAQRRRGFVRPLGSGDTQALARWLMLLADAEFQEEYSDLQATDPSMAKRFLLSRDRLEDSAVRRASWIIKHWDKRKIEGRSRGGSHGAWNGVRKGRVGYPGFWALEYEDLPKRERKARIMSESGMSSSTYYKLLKRAPEIRANIEKRRLEAAKNQPDFRWLLDGIRSSEDANVGPNGPSQADSHR